MTCPHVDDVVARFLDGDVERTLGLPLEDHAADCPICLRALAQSRHLDAAVAATADAQLDDPDGRVAAAIAAAFPEPVAPTPRRRLWPIVLTGVAAFAAGLAFAAYLGLSTPPPAPAPAPSEPPPALTKVPPTPSDLITIDDQAPGWTFAVRPLDAARRAELVLGSGDLDDAVTMLERARALYLGLPPLPRARAAEALRVQSANALLDVRTRAATLAVARVLARGDAVAQAVRPRALEHRDFKLRLVRELHDRCEADIALAGMRLDDVDFDRRVLSRCRRDDSLADAVATVARRDRAAPRAVDFLLDLWGATARGDDGGAPARSDADRARVWFHGLSSDAASHLLLRLQTSRSREVRRQCLLALGAIGDPVAIGPLLALVDRPNLHEAELAAYALGMMPASTAATLRAAVGSCRRPALLWIAMASIGDRAARDYLVGAGAPLELGERLQPEQVPVLAFSLRSRAPDAPGTQRP